MYKEGNKWEKIKKGKNIPAKEGSLLSLYNL